MGRRTRGTNRRLMRITYVNPNGGTEENYDLDDKSRLIDPTKPLRKPLIPQQQIDLPQRMVPPPRPPLQQKEQTPFPKLQPPLQEEEQTPSEMREPLFFSTDIMFGWKL